jgi:translation initiation factor 3 subunit H
MQASDTSEQYQLTKMRCLRDINVDSNTVGWYQSAPYKDYQTLNLLDTFISYEESVKKCVCIICDSKDAQRGSLALKALRLNKKFMDLYKVNTNVRSRPATDRSLVWGLQAASCNATVT